MYASSCDKKSVLIGYAKNRDKSHYDVLFVSVFGVVQSSFTKLLCRATNPNALPTLEKKLLSTKTSSVLNSSDSTVATVVAKYVNCSGVILHRHERPSILITCLFYETWPKQVNTIHFKPAVFHG